MRYTKKYAKEILDLWKDKTGYFDGSMTAEKFQSMLEAEQRITIRNPEKGDVHNV